VRRDVIFEEDISIQRSRESQMDIYLETIPSPPSVVQRETTIIPIELIVPFDPISPFDAPRDIIVGHKRPGWAQQTLQEA